MLTRSDAAQLRNVTALFSFLAGLLPSIYAALKLDRHLDQCCRLAGEYKNLQDRFRQVATISFHKPFEEFERDVQPFLKRLEKARSESFTAPEWCFKLAQRKVNTGDYTYTVDDSKSYSSHPVALQYITADADSEHEDNESS